MKQAQNSAQWRNLFLSELNLQYLLPEIYSIRYALIKCEDSFIARLSRDSSWDRSKNQFTDYGDVATCWSCLDKSTTPPFCFARWQRVIYCVCSAPWFCWGKLRRIVTVCPKHTSENQRNYITPLLKG